MTQPSIAEARRRVADDATSTRVLDDARKLARSVAAVFVLLVASSVLTLATTNAHVEGLVVAGAVGGAFGVALAARRALRALESAVGETRETLALVESALAEADRTRHLASLGEVSAVLAHEIRNPIAAVKGHSQLLVEMAGDHEKLRAKAQRIESEALRLEKLTDDLLTFARSGRLRTRTVDLRTLATQAASTVSSDIAVELPSEPVMHDVDAGRMLQVLENLLRNAMRHGRPPIVLSLRHETGAVRIDVRDHGPGIPAERLEKVFEPFVTDATRGTGLGLAVVRRVVDMHGATVTAANHPEGGAVFTIRLPRSETKGNEG